MTEQRVLVEVARHVRDFLLSTYWSKDLEGEKAIRAFSQIKGLGEALNSFGGLNVPKEGTVRWLVTEAVAKDLYTHAKRIIKNGCPQAHALAVIWLLDSLSPENRQLDEGGIGNNEEKDVT